ncbi:hypothetical protein IFY89_002478 [Salmonella enterica]|nr:hypothetical protein [Salmonella enterica]
MYELFSNLVFFFGNNFVDIRISDITELFRNEVNAEANFIGDTENHSRKGGNMSASQLATNWICIATAGETVDKRAIEEQWLLDAAELYDPSLYTALLWPEHSRNFGNMGEVLELKAERDDEGILRLYARLCPGISLLQANANGQLLFLSPEFTPDGNFRNTGKTYLEGLAVTDSPAGVSTTRLRFSRTKGKRIGPYKPLAFDEVREFKKEKGMSKTAKKGWRHFFSIEEPEATAEQETSQPDALLQRNITELGGSDGLKRTQEMAGKLVKPWDRFVQILKSVQTVIGLTLIPVLYPVLNRLADMGQTFARWMQLFPNIARVIGYAAMALLGFAAAGAIANIVLGVSKLIKLGAIALWKTLTSVTKIYTATVWIASKAVAAWNLTLKFLRGTLLAVRMAAIMAGIGINLMSWPVLLVIGAIGLLAAGCYLLIKHWDDVQAAVMNTAAFTAVAGVVEWLAGVFSTAWQWIKDGWNGFINLLTGFSPSQALSGMADGIVSMFDNIWQSVKGSFLKSWNWIVEKLNKIPGVNISLANESPPALTTNTLSTGGELKGIDKGGISKSVSNNSRAVTDNSRKINTVNIYPKEMITPGQLMEFQELGV